MMIHVKKWMSICGMFIVFVVIFAIFNSWGSADDDQRAQFEIASSLQTHSSVEMVNMWLVGSFPEESPVDIYFRLENLSDYVISLGNLTTLEVYYSGYWRIVPYTPKGFVIDGIIEGGYGSEGILQHPSTVRVIRITKEDYPLTSGLYRLRVPIIYAICPGISCIDDLMPPGRIHHDLVEEFYLHMN